MRLWILVLISTPLLGAPVLGQDLARGWSSAGIAYVTLEDPSGPAPAPTPAPRPGDVCPACQGSGKVGDGRVFQVCRDCNGTGKLVRQAVSAIQQKTADLLASPTMPSILPQPIRVQSCPGGVCPLPNNRAPMYTPPQPTTIRRGWIFRR